MELLRTLLEEQEKKPISKESAAKKISSFTDWKAAMVKAGLEELVQEDEFNKNHVYALKGDHLIGLWDTKDKTGLEYSRGMRFYKARRKLKKLNTSSYQGS